MFFILIYLNYFIQNINKLNANISRCFLNAFLKLNIIKLQKSFGHFANFKCKSIIAK
jgi:hypothetical protein